MIRAEITHICPSTAYEIVQIPHRIVFASIVKISHQATRIIWSKPSALVVGARVNERSYRACIQPTYTEKSFFQRAADTISKVASETVKKVASFVSKAASSVYNFASTTVKKAASFVSATAATTILQPRFLSTLDRNIVSPLAYVFPCLKPISAALKTVSLIASALATFRSFF